MVLSDNGNQNQVWKYCKSALNISPFLTADDEEFYKAHYGLHSNKQTDSLLHHDSIILLILVCCVLYCKTLQAMPQ